MLVLSRRLGEAIWIGPDVRIVVVDIGHGKIRLGIEAPSAVKVMREELIDKPAPKSAADIIRPFLPRT